jgi:hypothetical protein
MQVCKFASKKININKNHKSYITKLQMYITILPFFIFKILNSRNLQHDNITNCKVKICKCIYINFQMWKSTYK